MVALVVKRRPTSFQSTLLDTYWLMYSRGRPPARQEEG